MTVVHSVLTIILIDVCSVYICLPTTDVYITLATPYTHPASDLYPSSYANQWRIQAFPDVGANLRGEG